MINVRTAKTYCCEDISKIENYEKAINDTIIWQCHHRLETHNSNGERRLVDITVKELNALSMYYNRPAEELIFLTTKEHRILHTKGKPNSNKGMKCSEETKRKISEARKGKFINRKDLSKKVLCVETGEVFESIRDASRKTGISGGNISQVCQKNGRLLVAITGSLPTNLM